MRYVGDTYNFLRKKSKVTFNFLILISTKDKSKAFSVSKRGVKRGRKLKLKTDKVDTN